MEVHGGGLSGQMGPDTAVMCCTEETQDNSEAAGREGGCSAIIALRICQ